MKVFILTEGIFIDFLQQSCVHYAGNCIPLCPSLETYLGILQELFYLDDGEDTIPSADFCPRW